MTKTYVRDFRLISVCNTDGGGGKLALLWLLLLYKAHPRTKSGKASLQRAAAGASEEGVGCVGRELGRRQLWLQRTRGAGHSAPVVSEVRDWVFAFYFLWFALLVFAM